MVEVVREILRRLDSIMATLQFSTLKHAVVVVNTYALSYLLHWLRVDVMDDRSIYIIYRRVYQVLGDKFIVTFWHPLSTSPHRHTLRNNSKIHLPSARGSLS